MHVAWRVASACGLAGRECMWPAPGPPSVAQLRHFCRRLLGSVDLPCTLGALGRHYSYSLYKSLYQMIDGENMLKSGYQARHNYICHNYMMIDGESMLTSGYQARPAHACAIRPPAQYGRLRNTATCAIRPLSQHCHLQNMATCAIRPHVQYGHMCNTATHRARPAHAWANGQTRARSAAGCMCGGMLPIAG